MRYEITKDIFISYRREDSAGDTSRLVSSLKQYFSIDRIFYDTEAIPFGEDFTKVIKKSIKQCEVVLIMIGRKWLLNPNGQIPLMDENNWVRIEIETALKQGKFILPILIDGAKMPDKSDLPPSIATLHTRQAIEIYYRTWDNDVKQLAYYLQTKGIIFEEVSSLSGNNRWKLNKWLIGGLVVFATVAYLLLQNLIKPKLNDINNNNVSQKTGYVIAQPNLKPLIRKATINENNLSGTWKPVNKNASDYYRIFESDNKIKIELWQNNRLTTSGSAIKKDSLIIIKYRDTTYGEIEMRLALSKDGRTLTGSKSLGSKMKSNFFYRFTLVKHL